MSNILNPLQDLLLQYGLSVVGAIVILLVGRWLAGLISRLVRKLTQRADVDESLVRFAGSLAFWVVIIFAVLAALARLGIQTTSFIAVLGAAGLAIGLALEGALANFAAGVLILFFRPFKIGDLVEVAGSFGRVEEIQIFSTRLVTPDNKTVIVPNSQVTGGTITNYSQKGLLRIDLVYGIGYGDDLQKAKRILTDIVTSDLRVVKEPAPTVAVMELADSSVNFAVRPYVAVADYWDVYFDMTEQVKLRFDQEGVSIPFPQHDVHLFREN